MEIYLPNRSIEMGNQKDEALKHSAFRSYKLKRQEPLGVYLDKGDVEVAYGDDEHGTRDRHQEKSGESWHGG